MIIISCTALNTKLNSILETLQCMYSYFLEQLWLNIGVQVSWLKVFICQNYYPCSFPFHLLLFVFFKNCGEDTLHVNTLKKLNFANFAVCGVSRETQICGDTRNLIPTKFLISANREIFFVANRETFWAKTLTLTYEISVIRVLTTVYFSNHSSQLQILQFLPFVLSSLSWYSWKQKTNVMSLLWGSSFSSGLASPGVLCCDFLLSFVWTPVFVFLIEKSVWCSFLSKLFIFVFPYICYCLYYFYHCWCFCFVSKHPYNVLLLSHFPYVK